MSTVILGAGIIGLSTAYYLSLVSDHKITLIDSASSLHLSASAFAGGFLASDWFSPTSADLGALSFRLHRELAEKHDGQRRWGYVGSKVYSLAVDERRAPKKKAKERNEGWLESGESRAQMAQDGRSRRDEMLNADGTPAWISRQPERSLNVIAGEDECAQVEPRELCEFLLQECLKSCVVLKTGCQAEEVLRDGNGRITALRINGVNETIECLNLVITAGAWTPSVYKQLFPQSQHSIAIDPLAGHSLLFRSPRYKRPFISESGQLSKDSKDKLMSYAVFCASSRQFNYSPEAFARLAKECQPEIWIGGLNDSGLKLPETADGVKAMLSRKAIDDLRKTTVTLTGLSDEGSELNSDDLETIREGVCFRPASRTGVPIICEVKGEKGLFIVSGHGPWGISLSLGTGKVASELVLGMEPSADISMLGL